MNTSLPKLDAVSLRLEDGREVPCRLKPNPRAKRLILRLDPETDGAVITCPPGVSRAEALAFAGRHTAWLEARLVAQPARTEFVDGAEVPFLGIPHVVCLRPDQGRRVTRTAGEICVGGDPAFAARRLTDWFKREARRRILEEVPVFCARLGVRAGRVTVRDTRSRWGSCAGSGNLSFSWRLIFAPEDVLRYVVAHEVAHLREHNHGRRFWTLVEEVCPDMTAARAWLRAHGSGLHRIG